MKDDYRNYLFESYAKVVDYFKPKLFVFENVRILGISDNIKFSRESTDVQNMNVDFTFKKMYVFNSDNFSLEK